MTSDNDMNEMDQIEAYLAGRLAPAERQQVEEKIQSDSGFSKKVESMRQVTQLLRRADIQQRTQVTLQNLYRQRRQRSRRLTYWYGSGLTTLAACLAFAFYLAFTDVHLPVIEDDLLIVRGREMEERALTSEQSAYGSLLAGQQALKQGNYLKATNYLEKTLRFTDLRPYYREAAQWYLVLAYLYSDQPRRAEGYYQQLQTTDQPQYVVNSIDRWKVYVQIQRQKLL
ncbi:anti-sigma factor family protein [Larkinella terrae]|uniref:Tetratricopeptide repeat protein n=1 Tax=Larkinella terrae TaxID=2025311 RepID=A0A7K0EFH0_9BACT|nr:hypothetical protein [Larkinella terrae]MRS60321.1 hypothetical protein [Larkinella terrae]